MWASLSGRDGQPADLVSLPEDGAIALDPVQSPATLRLSGAQQADIGQTGAIGRHHRHEVFSRTQFHSDQAE